MGKTGDDPTVGLVLCTVDRLYEPDRMLNTLARQTRLPDHVVVVDQNDDDRLADIIKKYQDVFKITHVKTVRGLSRARNIGIKYLEEDLVGFPDDDCGYEKNVVLEVAKQFQKRREIVILSGLMIDFHGHRYLPRRPLFRNRPKHWHTPYVFCSANTFMKRKNLLLVGGFNERLGLGAKTETTGGEDFDICYQILSNKSSKARGCKNIRIVHEEKASGDSSSERNISNTKSMEYLARTHGGDLRTDAWLIGPRMAHAILFLLTGRRQRALVRMRELQAILRGIRQARLDGRRTD